MKKRMMSMAMMLALAMSVFTPATAFAAQEEFPQVASEPEMEVVFNEYDYIVAVREASADEQAVMSLSADEVDYIESNIPENEYLYRASLPVERLRDYYCYSDEAIKILKEYDGRRLEDAPEMRAVAATMSAGLGQVVKSKTRIGVLYSWDWSTAPVKLRKDRVAVGWEGTYAGGSNNFGLQQASSFCNVTYYQSGTSAGMETYRNITTSNAYHGATVEFPMTKTINGKNGWAKHGGFYVYMNLANQSGPAYVEVQVTGAYAHATTDVSVSVGFPFGASISFSGAYEDMDSRFIYIRP